ncbi:hypothetical protein ACFCV3_14325 [Kribbella sp. NPDC056345]|uniref:hypothetical protein n=1 Tax=Kribbella sp. NPDC056345 TaxID=3345789 RepID=UPI0035D878E0
MIGQLAQGAPSTLRPPSGDWIPSWRSPAFTGDMAHQLDPAGPGGLLTDIVSTGQPRLYGGDSALDVRPYNSFPGALTGEPESPAEPSAGPIGRVIQAVRNAFTRKPPGSSGAAAALGASAPTTSGSTLSPGAAAGLGPGSRAGLGSGTGAGFSSGSAAALGAAAGLGSGAAFALGAAAGFGSGSGVGLGSGAAAGFGSGGSVGLGPDSAAAFGSGSLPGAGPMAGALPTAGAGASSASGGAPTPMGALLGTSGSAGSAVSDGQLPLALAALMNEPTFSEVLAGGGAAAASSAPSLGAAPALASSLASAIGSRSTPGLDAVGNSDSAGSLPLAGPASAGFGPGTAAVASALLGTPAPSDARGMLPPATSSPVGPGLEGSAGSTTGAGTASAASALLGAPGSADSLPVARLAAPGLSQVTAALPADARRALSVPTLQNMFPSLTSSAGIGTSPAEEIAPGATAADLPVATQSAGPVAPAGAPAGLSRRRAGLGAPLAGPLPPQTLPVAAPPAGTGSSAVPSAADLAAAGSTEVAIPSSPAAAVPAMALARSVAGGNQMLSGPPVVAGAFQDVTGASGATVPLLGDRALSSDVSEMLSPPAGGDGASPAQPITYLPPHSVDSAGPSVDSNGRQSSAAAPGGHGNGSGSTAGLDSLPTVSAAPPSMAASSGSARPTSSATQGSMTTVSSSAGDAGRPLAVARPPAAGSAAAGGLVEGSVVESVSADDGATSVAIPSAAPAAAPTTASTAAAAGTPSGTGGALSAADVDGLARRLYEPIARRLRAELVVDRDRTGTLMDRMW